MNRKATTAKPNLSFIIAIAFMAIGFYLVFKGDLKAAALVLCMGFFLAFTSIAATVSRNRNLLRLIASLLLLPVPIIISLYTDNSIVKLLLYGLALAWAICILYIITHPKIKKLKKNR